MNNVFSQPIRGLIFDLDGTLYHMKWYMKGLLTSLVFPQSMLLPRYMKIRQLFSGKDMKTGDILLDNLAEQLAASKEKTAISRMRSWIEGPFYHAFEQTMTLMRNSRPEINETLIHLKNKGYRLGVLSDFGHIRERLDKLKIAFDSFDLLVSSEEAGALKPCARPFQTIADAWQLPPEQILVVGDRIDTDGEGAQRSGMLYQRISDRKNDTRDACDWPALKKLFENLPDIN